MPRFVECIEQQLNVHPQGVGEYPLIQTLHRAGHFDGWVSADPTLALFQKHFAVMHCLYRLQRQYAAQGQPLQISPLSIQLFPPNKSQSNNSDLVTAVDGVRTFYLDWTNFISATPDTVVELLSGFWRRYTAMDESATALSMLGLRGEVDWEQIQAQYRRLAAEHHPDKGGNSAEFARVRKAYETLKTRFRR